MFRLFRFLKGQALKLFFLSLFLMILTSLFNVVQPLFLTYEISIVKVLTHETTGDINILWFVINSDNAWVYFWAFCAIMFIFSFFGIISGLFSFWFSAKVSLLIAQNIRNAAYDHVLKYSFSQIDKISSGSIVVRITNDVQRIQFAFLMLIAVFIQSVFVVIGGSIVAFTTVWQIGMVILGTIAFATLIVGSIGRRLMPLFGAFQSSLDEVATVMQENILGARVIKSFNLQQNQTEEFDFLNKRLRNYSFRSWAWLMPIMQMIPWALNFGINLIMMIGGILLKSGADKDPLLADQIYGTVQIMVMVLASAVSIIMSVSIVLRIRPSVRRINEIFDIKPEITDNRKSVNFPKRYDIEFKNVSFSYLKNNNNILSNLSFKVKQGSSLGIIGSSGCGKTTLVTLIPRLYDVTGGSIKIGGVDVSRIKKNSLRDNIRIALQEQILFAGNIEYNLRYAKLNASREEMMEASKNACAWEFISKLTKTWQSPVEQRGSNFSGGQKQRLCLTRALLGNPKILILDDSTSALDLLTEKTVKQQINTTLKNTTKIIVSQRVASIKDCDQILVLDDGKISGIGKHDKLVKTNELYRNIVESQLKVMNYE